MKRSYKVVDVFTSRPLMGNPVAVILDADDLDTEAMQAIAAWTNLSETTFVLSPTSDEADYRVRIFTPRSELPFAGHPTLGTAHAILEAGRINVRDDGRLIQQCNIGPVELTVQGQDRDRQLTFGLPSAKIEPLHHDDVSELELILGVKIGTAVAPAIVNVGPIWAIARMEDAAAVLSLKPNLSKLADFERRLGITGLTVFGAHHHGDATIEVRTFAPSCGVDEDPVCGSGNASVAAFQWERNLLPIGGSDYIASQGRQIGRDGRVKVTVTASGKVHVGGTCITCIDGFLTL